MPQKAKDGTRQREVAARLRALRLELNYEQFEIAETVGISPQGWSYYENGKRQFDFDVAVRLCEAIGKLPGKRGLTLDYIYRGEQKGGVPLAFYRKLQQRARDEHARIVGMSKRDIAKQSAAGKKSTRAKVEKPG
jgi:transcriptional regulator with XRE-family HTH domain